MPFSWRRGSLCLGGTKSLGTGCGQPDLSGSGWVPDCFDRQLHGRSAAAKPAGFRLGEQEPVDTAAGVVHYELTLKNVCPVEGTNMYAEANLSLVAERPGKKVIYSGCRWKSIATSGGVGSKQKHTLKLTAVKRQEEVVSNG